MIRPLDYCGWCGNDMQDVAYVASDGVLCCCDECRRDRNNDLQELRATSTIPCDYND